MYGVGSRKMTGMILFHHLNIQIILTINTILHCHAYSPQLITYPFMKLVVKLHRFLRIQVLCSKTVGLEEACTWSFRKRGRVAFVEKEVQEIPVFQQSGTQESGNYPGDIKLSLIQSPSSKFLVAVHAEKKGFKINFLSYHPQRYISFSFA